MQYTIGMVAKKVELSIDTLRYYEKLGLITPQRKTNGHRFYVKADLEWLAFIKRVKETGLSLKEIQRYAQLRKAGHTTLHERMSLLERQVEHLNREKEQLDQNIAFIQNKIALYQKMLSKI